jgi:hypothetical protein
MVYHAKSQRVKEREFSDLRELYYKRAVKLFTDSQNAPSTSTSPDATLSLAAACKAAEAECFAERKQIIRLSTSTLHRRIHGGRSTREAHEEQRWLNDAEERVVLDMVIDLANRGFPLSHRRLKEHVDEIARARSGDKFPEDGVGHQWTRRFVSDHTELKTYWSAPLDKSRARAVNPMTKEHYFDLLEKVIEGDGGDNRIPPELIYGADESGFQKGLGQKERVIGGKGKKRQHQQRSGDRENITVLVWICGDGTTGPPLVIYKGEAFQASWKQNNPLNTS